MLIRLLIVVASVGSAPVAFAQQEEDATRARELFERAVPLLADESYGEAHDLLVEALELDPRASTAFNLASAFAGLSRAREAYDLLDRVERGDFGELPDQYGQSVETLRLAIESQLGRIEIRADGASTVSIELDDEAVGTIHDDSVIQRHVDPGSHHVRGTAEGYEPSEERVTVGAGEQRRVRLSLQLVARDSEPSATLLTPVAAPEEPADDDGGSAWLWVGIAIGAAAIAAGIVLGVVLLGGDDDRAFMCDPIFGCTDV